MLLIAALKHVADRSIVRKMLLIARIMARERKNGRFQPSTRDRRLMAAYSMPRHELRDGITRCLRYVRSYA